MALSAQSLLDREFGDCLNHDFAQYHVPFVGTAAAIANAVHHATGLRIRRLPITPDRPVPGA